MAEVKRTTGMLYRPLLLTTEHLYPRWRRTLWHVRVPERRSLIVVLPQGAPRARAALVAVARRYQARGGSVRVIEGSRGVERYYEMRECLSGGRR